MSIYERNISGLKMVNFPICEKDDKVRCPVCLEYAFTKRLYTFYLSSEEKPEVFNEYIYRCDNPACLITYFRLN